MTDYEGMRARCDAATPGPWDWSAHAHSADGCKCASCVDEPYTGFVLDHAGVTWCDEVADQRNNAGERNQFGREFTGCSKRVISLADAEFAAHARTDLPQLLDMRDQLLDLLDGGHVTDPELSDCDCWAHQVAPILGWAP